MIGGSLAPFGVVLDRLRGSIAPMTNRGGVIGQCPGPIARGIVNRGGVDVMAKNTPLFQPRFLRMARGAQCLPTVVCKPGGANDPPRDHMVYMFAQCDPPRQLARLAQWLFGQLPRPYRLPNGRFIFPVVFPFGPVDCRRGGMIDAHG